jgi:NAD(P)-dependent dehydrogenase (short-subunit alcohol dehydrogenase family)
MGVTVNGTASRSPPELAPNGATTTTTTTTTTTHKLPHSAQEGQNSHMDGLQTSASLPLRGKVFAITGGASGIGLATAKIISRRGATVCIGDIDAEAMKAADAYFAQQQPNAPPHSVTRVDISKSKEVESWFDGIMSQFGRLDGAANVAGVIGKIHGVCPVSELEDEEWLRIININLSGTMYCMRAELRRVVDGGSIVNVSSIHGLKGKSIFHPYSLALSEPPGSSPRWRD